MSNNSSKKTDFLTARPSFWSGFARLFDFFGTFDDYNRSRNEQEADARAFNNDWNMVVQDFNHAASGMTSRLDKDIKRKMQTNL